MMSLSVQTLENGTDSITTTRLTSVSGPGGAVYDVVETLELTLSKSAIELHYPVAYLLSMNAAPSEAVLQSDRSGRSFNWLLNPCVDDPQLNGACGWVLDDEGVRVPGSNGFCCRCDAVNYFGNSRASRANLQCSLLNNANSESAHCLRMGPLWYAAYEIAPPIVSYRIDVVLARCRTPAANESSGAACSYSVARLSPTAPGACIDFPAATGSLAAVRTCGAWLELEGDLAAYESPPELTSKLLLVPQLCTDLAACGNRTLESPERWMLVDRALSTSDCDKTGVGYASFQSQGSRCEAPVGSCLRGTLDAMYAADAGADARGQRGTSWLKYLGGAGGTFVPVLDGAAGAGGSGARLTLVTTRAQRSIVAVQVDAGLVRTTLRVADARILSLRAPSSFEASSVDGYLLCSITNVASVAGSVTVALTCLDSIVAVPAQQLTLAAAGAPGAFAEITFALRTLSRAEGSFSCVVSVSNALYRMTDSAALLVNTTATLIDAGAQGGSPLPGNPLQGAAASPRAVVSCEDACPDAFDLLCAVVHRRDSSEGGAGSPPAAASTRRGSAGAGTRGGNHRGDRTEEGRGELQRSVAVLTDAVAAIAARLQIQQMQEQPRPPQPPREEDQLFGAVNPLASLTRKAPQPSAPTGAIKLDSDSRLEGVAK